MPRNLAGHSRLRLLDHFLFSCKIEIRHARNAIPVGMRHKSNFNFTIIIMNDVQELKLDSADERLKAALDAGLQWGRVRRLTHPKMRQYIFTTKGDLQVIDLLKTMEALERGLSFIREIAERGGGMLLVGTQPAAVFHIEEFGKRLGFPYVTDRWLGGTLTNFKTLTSRIQYLKDLEEKISSDEFASYTKKERLGMQKEAEDLRDKFEGLRNMVKLPDAVFLAGVKRHSTALREARRMRIPVIAVVNTSDDPAAIAYPIPGNDNSALGVGFILQEIERAWTSSKKSESSAISGSLPKGPVSQSGGDEPRERVLGGKN